MSFSEKLISWYHQNHRALPWRETTDPYKIWLSEIILQQTRIQQGLPYYERFVQTYPTVQDLASAPQEEVLRLWQGLGYYSRARNLHEAAKMVVQEYGGQFPTTYKELLKLKGVGKYTAAAIASFAFQEKVAAVDGNVYRFLSRMFGVEEDTLSGKGQKVFEQLANELISEEQPDLFNQATMEFGATHCMPSNPNCMYCPFSQECVARKEGKQAVLPVKIKKLKVKQRYLYYMVMESEGRLWMKERQGKDIWQGLYDFPMLETSKPVDEQGVMEQMELFNGHKVTVEEVSPIFKHILTHQRLFIQFYHIKLEKDLDLEEGDWYSMENVERLPKPILIEKYLKEKERLLDK